MVAFSSTSFRDSLYNSWKISLWNLTCTSQFQHYSHHLTITTYNVMRKPIVKSPKHSWGWQIGSRTWCMSEMILQSGYLGGLRSSLGGWTQKVKSWYWGRPLVSFRPSSTLACGLFRLGTHTVLLVTHGSSHLNSWALLLVRSSLLHH